MEHNDSDYKLYADGRFVLKNYNQKKSFSNFLPGIAGLHGTPMWLFYVNRGQAVASFGTRNKDNAILEFFPANKAYQIVSSVGFRTFIKLTSDRKTSHYEAFAETGRTASVKQDLEMSSHEITLKEAHRPLGLEISVRYFTIPGEPLAALAREVTFTNTGLRAMDLEVLDGLPRVNPYGMNEFFTKEMSRTIEAWMITDNLAKKAPFFRLKVDAADRPEVIFIRGGNFFFSLLEEGRKAPPRLLEPLVDPARVFGSVLSFAEPRVFYEHTPFKLYSEQAADSKTPSAFAFASFRLGPGKSKKIHSFYGHAESLETLNRYLARAKAPDYFEKKRLENKKNIEGIKSAVFTATANAAFDLYCGQTYLDNVLRGGMPVYFGDGGKDTIFYVYSRKHGDLERDYNRFLVEPGYFSQGDGNYRDVNQNRRSDVWFNPWIRDLNIRTFLNLVQLDGFNPLVIKGASFQLRRSGASDRRLSKIFGRKAWPVVREFLSRPFSPGELCRLLKEHGLVSSNGFSRLFGQLSPFLAREERAEHGEGYWVDHWTYNLDLIESYLAIFPEDREGLLFGRNEYTFYDNDHWVRPRDQKYVLEKNGRVRQFGAVARSKEKSLLIEGRDQAAALVRTKGGKGAIYKTTLFVKLLCLFANKFGSMDPEGVGIEMEADKPSWYDALNGLPALLGSSLPETFELKRLALFMIHSLEDAPHDGGDKVRMPVELYEFIRKLEANLNAFFSGRQEARMKFPHVAYWDAAATAKEKFRKITAFGISGKERTAAVSEVKIFLEHAREKIEIGLEKAFHSETKLYPTYFENEVTRFRASKRKDGSAVVRPLAFRQKALPYFLEGPVHALKVEKDPSKRHELLKAVRGSPLYDPKLGMYKVNAPFGNVSLEIGRACVFAPGWLENESIWLHMEYKFLLEMLKGGLTGEFFGDFKRALVPFQPPARYGRSVLENSSFIVSSAFADESLHGAGFVARLSGSTAEFLSMWLLMMVGRHPFILGPDKKLSLRFEPNLPSFLFVKEAGPKVLFTKDGETKVYVPEDCLAFMFLGKTLVFYHNPRHLDTFGRVRASVKKITLRMPRGETMEFKGDTVPSPFAAKVRDEFVPRIDIELG